MVSRIVQDSLHAATDSLQHVQDWKILALQKMDTVFHSLAHQAGVATEHFWPIFIRQQIIDGFTNIVGWLIPALLWVWGLTALKRWYKAHPKWADSHYHTDDSDDFLGWAYGIVLVIAGICLLIGVWATIVPALAQMLNPEYYAVKSVFQLIRGAAK